MVGCGMAAYPLGVADHLATLLLESTSQTNLLFKINLHCTVYKSHALSPAS